ncbi:hypothetical protein [[Micrococcus luteus] ATCC 49442]|uniref:hypothetical protein n=1 Tax=[Micrococcus luteus] ATCC 49442 TaxID=2698727 RepID=UPI0013D96160|nr:hypothetical protein [[Micrococcus luteus] ATCC 49442]
MTVLGTAHHGSYSTIYLAGLPPFGLGWEQYKALGYLAWEVHSDHTRRVVRIPDNEPKPPATGWSITAPAEDMARIQAVAQGILSGNLESLASKYRDETTGQEPTE